MQFPPEAWLRMSLHNSSITWVAIRPSGRVVLRALGDCGHIPPDKLTTTWSLDSTKTSGFDQSPPDIQLETKLFSSIGNKYKLFPTMCYVYSTQIFFYTNYYNTRTNRGLSLQQIFAFFFHFFRMASLSWTLVPWSFSIFHVCRLYCWHKLISQIETRPHMFEPIENSIEELYFYWSVYWKNAGQDILRVAIGEREFVFGHW